VCVGTYGIHIKKNVYIFIYISMLYMCIPAAIILGPEDTQGGVCVCCNIWNTLKKKKIIYIYVIHVDTCGNKIVGGLCVCGNIWNTRKKKNVYIFIYISMLYVCIPAAIIMGPEDT